MNDTSKQCYMCTHLDRFYTKGTTRFNKADCGWCCMKVGVVQIHDGCDKFEKLRAKKRYTPMLKITLNTLLTEISEVRKVLEAEKEEFGE